MSVWVAVGEQSPERESRVLTVWPVLQYDEDGGGLSDVVIRYDVHVVEFLSNGRFDDPPGADAIGDYFGDDHEVAEQPTHWMPLPDLPRAFRAICRSHRMRECTLPRVSDQLGGGE